MSESGIVKIKGGGGKKNAISFIRMIAMEMIIICHIMQYYDFVLAWWFNIGVQIFLCISGFLYGQKAIENIARFYNQRIKKILVPYYLTLIPFAFFEFAFCSAVISFKSLLEAIVLHTTLKGAGHLWFVPTILLCYLITPLIQIYRDEYVRSKRSWYVFLSFGVISVSLFFGLFNEFFNPAWIACYVIGYALGVNEKNLWVENIKLTRLIGIIALVGNVLQIFFQYVKRISFPGCGLFYNYNHVALGVFIFLVLKQFLEHRNLEKFGIVLQISDEYSYEVYLVHQLIILGPFSLLAVSKNMAVGIILIIAGIFLLAMVLKKGEKVIYKVIEAKLAFWLVRYSSSI